MLPPPTTSRETFSWWFLTYMVWEKIQENLQQTRQTRTLKRYKHHKIHAHDPQGQRQQASEKWGHLQIPVPTNQLPRRINWGIWQDIWRQIQGTSQSTITYSSYQHHKTASQPRLFFHCVQGVPRLNQEHQGSHVH